MPDTSLHSPSRTRLVSESDVRERCGIDSDDASTSDVQAAIDDAQAQFVNDAARWIQGVELEGDADGSNTDFELPKPWRLIADDTGDETIDSSDVHVYTEDDSTTPPTRSTQTVSSVDSRFGVITLSSAPSSGDEVFFDGYVLKRVWDATLIKSAIKALASWYTVGRAREGNEVLTGSPGRDAETGNQSDPAGLRHLRDYKRTLKTQQGGSSFSVASKDKSHGSGSGVL